MKKTEVKLNKWLKKLGLVIKWKRWNSNSDSRTRDFNYYIILTLRLKKESIAVLLLDTV